MRCTRWRGVCSGCREKENPEARPHMEAVAAIAAFEPILCEVAEAVGS